VIRGFRHKGLRQLFNTGETAAIQSSLHERCLRRLDVLTSAKSLRDPNVPGLDFHALKGFKPARYTLHVNGPWCITFEFNDGDAYAVDLEQYH
jgi:proteic killer suppression protein